MKLISVVHFLLIIVAIFSPFIFSWWIIVLGSVILWLQYYFVGNCVLTKKQFSSKDKDMTYWYFILSKFFPNINKKKVKKIVRNILPVSIILLSIIIQVIFGFDPVIF